MPPSYLDKVNATRQTTSQRGTQEQDLGAMLAELKKIQLASLMGSQGKSTVILTDQTDLGDKIAELTTKLVDAVKSCDNTEVSTGQLSKLSDIQQALQDLSRVIAASARTDGDVVTAIKNLKLSPNITVPKPEVQVTVPKIDWEPLQRTIQTAFEAMPRETEEVNDVYDLSRYRAMDIQDNDDRTIQYIGFVNPEGNWYIIENNVNGNQLRYVFGVDDYGSHFAKASTFQYQLLNGAIDALQA